MSIQWSLVATLALFGSLLDHAIAAGPLEVSNRTCLFLDDHFIATKSGLRREWHQGQPHPDCLVVPDKPWEGNIVLYGSVLFDVDSRKFRMWYETYAGGRNYHVCYAESDDGIAWTKPELGLWEFEGSRQNNIVVPGSALPNVFIDPAAPDGEKYKMFVWVLSHPNKSISHHSLFSSGDGIAWKYVGQRRFGPDGESGRWVKDSNVIRWDHRAGRWAASHRSWSQFPIGEKNDIWRRTVALTWSDNLLDGWSPLKVVIKPDQGDDATAATLSRKRDKPDWSELYAMPIFSYGNHDLGFLTLIDLIDGSDVVAGGGRVELCFSNDGAKWQRPAQRNRLIAQDKRWPDLIPIYCMTTPPIERDGRLWIYYTDANSLHPTRPLSTWTTRIRLASWRKDGFASLVCTGRGELVTRLLDYKGDRLLLNCRTDQNGRIRVALLDESNTPLPGFGIDDCVPVTGDGVALPVTWSKDLSDLDNKSVRVKIIAEDARLWSLRFGGASE